MKSYQASEPGKPLELREMETPEPNGKEVLVKTIACGVCHSDVHIHSGAFNLGGGNSLPIPCLLYTSPSPRDRTRSRMPSSA